MRRATVSMLHHDVGKRIARTARNVASSPLSAPILAMLVKDLYVIDGTRRASEVYAARAQTLSHETALEGVPAALARIDALEARVRAGEHDAVREALRLAREISDAIGALLALEVGA